MISNSKNYGENFEVLLPLFMDVTNDLFVIVRLDYEYKIEFINNCNFLDVLGYSHDSLLETSFLDLIYSDDAERITNVLRNMEVNQKLSEEIRIKTSMQDDYWVEINLKKFKSKFSSKKVLINLKDISKQKDLESKLASTKQNSEEKYRLIYENANDLIRVFNQDFEYEYLNEKVHERMLGYSKADLIGKRQLPLIHPEDREQAIFASGKILRKGSGSYQARFKHKTGDYIWLELSFKNFIDNQGEEKILSIGRDITESKLAEQKLKESEEKFRILFELTPASTVVSDAEGKIILFNRKFCKLHGIKKPELLKGRTVLEFFTKKDWPKLTESIKKTAEGIPLESIQYTMLKEDGSQFQAEANSSGIRDKNGKITNLIGVVQDITERKRIEQKLKASEMKYRMLFENSPIALMDQDFSEMKRYIDELEAAGIDDFEKYFEEHPQEILKCITRANVIDVNRKTLEVYKANSKEELLWRMNHLGKDIDQINRKEFISDNKKEILALIKGKTEYESELVSKTSTGDHIHLYAKTSLDPRFENTWSKVIVSIIDISERKHTEEKLKESEEKYHQLFETSPDGVALVNSEGRIIECNSALEKITGYSKTKFIGKSFIELEMYDPKTIILINEGFSDIFDENKIESIKFPFVHKDGQIRWAQISGSLITLKGKFHIITVLHDITITKTAEEELKKSKEKYRDLLETSSIGVMEIDVINNQITYINPKLLEIIGYKKEELNSVSLRDEIIHPKDLQKLMESNEERELEFRIFDKNGKLKWVSGKRIPHFDDYENLVSTRLWLDDITEKKMYEELIYELNVNFLNFTADIQNNIKLLLNTGRKLLNGDLILYAHKVISEDKEMYYTITSDNDSHIYDFKKFSELHINEFLKENHDFPQTFTDIDQEKFISDPFIKKAQAEGSFGKVIRSQRGLDNIVCVFYKNNPIINGQDKLVLFLVCDAIEIEQRRWQVQQELEEQNTTLNKINQLKTELFSRTSHELKTPLISIKGFTELLLTLHKSKLDTETISILEEIKDGSKRLEKIINLLLKSAKLEAGQLELRKSKEDLTFLINFCVKELKGLATLRNHSILFDQDNQIEALFDKERIYEVISNLLLNAVKYTPPGGKISIQAYPVDCEYIVSITDNGIGFTEEEKKQAFKQFGKIERYGQGWDVAIEGTGLGLYITKRLVELHGGKIWLESEGRDKGTTFYFSIPMNL